jgi:phosphoribosylglycinamide formyltransferase-1
MSAQGQERIPAVVLLSGSGSNLQALINAGIEPTYPVEIVGVISNIAGVKGLERAERSGIPVITVVHSDFDSRDAFEQKLAEAVDSFSPQLVILAGFMRILGEPFVTHYEGRMLNIHPSLLPKYRGLNTHQRALDAGDQYQGATVHFVTSELDGGPSVLQARVPILHDDSAEKIAARVLCKEHVIYPLVVRWFGEGRLLMREGKAYFDSRELTEPLKLEELAQ